MLLALSFALGRDDPEADFRGGLRQARVGSILGWSGAAGVATGVLLAAGDDSGTTGVVLGALLGPPAGLTTLAGTALLDVGALRASRAVEAAGGQVSQVPGHVCWVLYGGAVVAAVTGFTDGWWGDERVWVGTAVTSSLLLGSLGAAQWQAGLARSAGAKVGLAPGMAVPPRDKSLPEFWLRVVPAATPESAGLVVVGAF